MVRKRAEAWHARSEHLVLLHPLELSTEMLHEPVRHTQSEVGIEREVANDTGGPEEGLANTRCLLHCWRVVGARWPPAVLDVVLGPYAACDCDDRLPALGDFQAVSRHLPMPHSPADRTSCVCLGTFGVLTDGRAESLRQGFEAGD